FINDLIVESYIDSAAKVLSPVGLMITGMSRNSVSLQWQTRSFNQTAVEVWRGTDSTGTGYHLLETLPAAATFYSDQTVTSNSNYFYVVRAVNAAAASNFSNPVSATPYAYEVYMNFSTLETGYPWNNLLYVPSQGFVWPSNFFRDDIGAPTNMGLVESGLWAGEANFGMSTGNNSGVVPDAVMKGGYAIFPGQVGSMQITGLDMTLLYDITVFGSSDLYGDQNALYTANGKSCLLNAQTNETGELTIYGVRPDQAGNINLSVVCGTPASQDGVLGAVIISGHSPKMGGNTPPVPAKPASADNQAVLATAPVLSAPRDSSLALKALEVYPNPVRNYFTLCVPATGPDRVQVAIYDALGQLTYHQQFSGLVAGNNFFQINSVPGMAGRGVYFLQVTYGDGRTVKVFRIV